MGDYRRFDFQMNSPSSSPPSALLAPNNPAVPLEEALSKRARGVTGRVVVLSLLLALFFGWAIPVIDYKLTNTYLGATHLPPGAIMALLLLVVVINPILRGLSRRAVLERNETLTVYLSCLFSTLVPGMGGNNYFVSFIIGSFYYATRENKWFDLLKGLPPWYTPALGPHGSYNRAVVEGWYNGLPPGGTIPWGAWLVPLLAWGLFFVAAFSMMMCMSVMLRAQWGDNEALAFPLLKLPLEMTEGTGTGRLPSFFSTPAMWGGFGVAASIQLLNGLHVYFPDVPSLNMSLDMAPYFSEAPWNQMGTATLFIYPVAIGITFLLTTEVSLSLWFFYWLLKFQLLASYGLGYMPNTLPHMTGGNAPVFLGYQEVGANLAYAGLIFWTARRHLGHIARRAVGRDVARRGETREALPYPVAFWGFWASFGLMVAWGIAAGMSWPVSVLLWTSYLIIAVVLSRVVAEGGLLFVHHSWMPLGSLMGLLGAGPHSWISPAHGLYPAAVTEYATIQDYRGSLMPSFVQSFKLAHDRGIAARPLLALLGGVIGIGLVMSFAMNVRLGYETGGLGLGRWLSDWGPHCLAGNVSNYASLSQSPDLNAWVWMTVGVLLTMGMVLARSRFGWFPLHPIGYIMAFTYPLWHFWFSIFIGWGCKVLLSKYGGHETVRRTTPFFLGLALGDVAMMLFWLLIDGWQGRTGHQLMPA